MLWRMRIRVMQPGGTWGVTYNWNMVRSLPPLPQQLCIRHTFYALCQSWAFNRSRLGESVANR